MAHFRRCETAVDSDDSAPILFYDGNCGLCARSVQWCLAHDHRRRVRFAALQGKTYAALAVDGKPGELDSVVLFDRGRLLLRSDALLGILQHFGGAWPFLASMGKIVPRPLRDAAYGFVARRRLAWFGDASRCRVPTAAESARFLP